MEQTPSVSAGLTYPDHAGAAPQMRKPTQQEEAVGHTQGPQGSREGGESKGASWRKSRTSLKSTGKRSWSTQGKRKLKQPGVEGGKRGREA